MEITQLTADQIPQAAATLGRAFHDDPLQQYILPDEDERRTLGAPLFERVVRYSQSSGRVLTTPGVDGVALWTPPRTPPMSGEAAVAAGFSDLPGIIGENAVKRFADFFAAIEPYHHRDASDDHWYLAVLGVDPSQQGRGIGHALIQPILAEADAAGVACYLETAQPTNVGFYVTQGFEVLVDAVEPVSGVRFWTFRRHAPA